jgi:hypothetical protein
VAAACGKTQEQLQINSTINNIIIVVFVSNEKKNLRETIAYGLPQ